MKTTNILYNSRFWLSVIGSVLFIGIPILLGCSGPTAEEIKSQQEEEQRKNNCLYNISVVDEKSIKKDYSIIGTVSFENSNISLQPATENEVIQYLKEQACDKSWWNADAIIYPEHESGPIHTTYTSKVIRWNKDK